MTPSKKKAQIFIIISCIAFLPNLACLLIALFILYPAPVILYIVPSVMIVACITGFIYGLSLRKKTDAKLDF